MAVAEQLQVRDKLYIGGRWVDPSGSEKIDVVNAGHRGGHGPHPGRHAGRRRPRRRGRSRAFHGWADTPARRRAELLSASSPALAARGDELAALIAQELGMPLKLSEMIQAGLPAMDFGSMAQLSSRCLGGGDRQLAGRARAGRRGRGDHPLELPPAPDRRQGGARAGRRLHGGAQALARSSPLNAFVLAEVIDDVGLPDGVFNLVTGTGPVVGEAIAAHPDVDMVSFTGSTRAGRRVSELASAHRQDGGPRAGRQVAQRDPRRRRLREGGHRRRGQVLPELRPDVQRAHAHARAARAPCRGRADRRRRRGETSRPAIRSPRGPGWAARVRRPARARARLHRQGRRGGRQAGDRRRRRPRGPGSRLLRRSDGLLRRHAAR